MVPICQRICLLWPLSLTFILESKPFAFHVCDCCVKAHEQLRHSTGLRRKEKPGMKIKSSTITLQQHAGKTLGGRPKHP